MGVRFFWGWGRGICRGIFWLEGLGYGGMFYFRGMVRLIRVLDFEMVVMCRVKGIFYFKFLCFRVGNVRLEAEWGLFKVI